MFPCGNRLGPREEKQSSAGLFLQTQRRYPKEGLFRRAAKLPALWQLLLPCAGGHRQHQEGFLCTPQLCPALLSLLSAPRLCHLLSGLWILAHSPWSLPTARGPWQLSFSEGVYGCPHLWLVPLLGQGRSGVLWSCWDEELENCYSLGPGVTSVFILGSPRMWAPGGTYFPVLVMSGSTK